MIFSRFDGEQFFNETVLPTISDNPEYERRGNVPLLADTMPVGDLDNRESMDFYRCRLAYFPVSAIVEVGLVDMSEAERLPVRVQTDTVSIPGEHEIEAVVAARYRTNYVFGLRAEGGEDWHTVRKDSSSANYLLSLIRKKTSHNMHRYTGENGEEINAENIRLLRAAEQMLIEQRPELTKAERDKIRSAWAKDIRLAELSKQVA